MDKIEGKCYIIAKTLVKKGFITSSIPEESLIRQLATNLRQFESSLVTLERVYESGIMKNDVMFGHRSAIIR